MKPLRPNFNPRRTLGLGAVLLVGLLLIVIGTNSGNDDDSSTSTTEAPTSTIVVPENVDLTAACPDAESVQELFNDDNLVEGRLPEEPDVHPDAEAVAVCQFGVADNLTVSIVAETAPDIQAVWDDHVDDAVSCNDGCGDGSVVQPSGADDEFIARPPNEAYSLRDISRTPLPEVVVSDARYESALLDGPFVCRTIAHSRDFEPDETATRALYDATYETAGEVCDFLVENGVPTTA